MLGLSSSPSWASSQWRSGKEIEVRRYLPMANVRKQKPRMEPRMPMTGRIHMLGSEWFLLRQDS